MHGEDERFVREGRSLRQWLPELLGPEPAVRRRAENAICAMRRGTPVADATVYKFRPKDLDAHRRAWGEAVRAIINDPGFPGRDFVIEALGRIKQDARESDSLWALWDQYFHIDPRLDKDASGELLEQIKAGYARRKAGTLPNSSGPLTLEHVMEHAGPVLLTMPDRVRSALRDPALSRMMAAALENLGPLAVEFAPDLLSPDQPSAAEYGIVYPSALASVAREDPPTIAQLLQLAKSGKSRLASSAAATLARIGPAAARLAPALVDELLAMSDERVPLHCLAAVAPERRDVFERAARLALPGPPMMRPMPDLEAHQYDARMYQRGEALSALGQFMRFAPEAVGILVEALATFEEYDPDWRRGGEHARIIKALEHLAPSSASAVPVLLPLILGTDGTIHWGIVHLLGVIGPDAAEALPVLRGLAEEIYERFPNPDPNSRTPDENIHPLEWALHRIGLQ